MPARSLSRRGQRQPRIRRTGSSRTENLEREIAELLMRPVGSRSHCWELFPRVGFTATNLDRAVAPFYTRGNSGTVFHPNGGAAVAEPNRPQFGKPAAASGDAEEDREPVADQFAATAGEGRWAVGEARDGSLGDGAADEALLAPAGSELAAGPDVQPTCFRGQNGNPG